MSLLWKWSIPFFKRLLFDLFEIIGQKWILHYFAESEMVFLRWLSILWIEILYLKNLIKAWTTSEDNHIFLREFGHSNDQKSKIYTVTPVLCVPKKKKNENKQKNHIKIENGIFEILIMPSFNKFWLLLFLGPIRALQVVKCNKSHSWYHSWNWHIWNTKCLKS